MILLAIGGAFFAFLLVCDLLDPGSAPQEPWTPPDEDAW